MKHKHCIKVLQAAVLQAKSIVLLNRCLHLSPDGKPCESCQEHITNIEKEIILFEESINCLKKDSEFHIRLAEELGD